MMDKPRILPCFGFSGWIRKIKEFFFLLLGKKIRSRLCGTDRTFQFEKDVHKIKKNSLAGINFSSVRAKWLNYLNITVI